MQARQVLVSFLAVLMLVVLCRPVAAKNIVILMDGTWNNSIQSVDGDSKSPTYTVQVTEESTNIARMWPLLEKSQEQYVIYLRGIGTDRDPLRDVVDGVFGKEGLERVETAYEMLSKGEHRWQEGDHLCIFGFSRGAATARMLARKLRDKGNGAQKPIPVEFLGLFDTVASMGIPRLETENITNIGSYHKAFDQMMHELSIPNSVKRVVHLVSRDEERSVFAPTLVILDSPGQETIVDETWFGGNHGDVGGGWKDENEKDREFRRRMITLRYMLMQPHGLSLVPNWCQNLDVKVDSKLAHCGTKHTWSDYPFSTRITGRLPRSLKDEDLPPGAKRPAQVHPSANGGE